MPHHIAWNKHIWITVHFITLHSVALDRFPLHHIGTTLHNHASQYTSMHSITIQYSSLHCTPQKRQLVKHPRKWPESGLILPCFSLLARGVTRPSESNWLMLLVPPTSNNYSPGKVAMQLAFWQTWSGSSRVVQRTTFPSDLHRLGMIYCSPLWPKSSGSFRSISFWFFLDARDCARGCCSSPECSLTWSRSTWKKSLKCTWSSK